MAGAFTSSPRSDWAPGTLNLREPKLSNNSKFMRSMKIKGPKAKSMKLVPLKMMVKAPASLKPTSFQRYT